MATNENVNKVIYGNQTVMDITDTTAEESDVASGEVFYKANGERSVGTLNADSAVWGSITGTLSDQNDLQIELNRAYTKTASETSSIDDLDVIPVQKISASSDGRRNIKFRNLKSVLKTYFDDFYSTFSGSYNDLSDKPTIPTVDQTYSATSSNAQSGKAVASAISGKADTSLLKSTVGWTGKNKFNYNAFKSVTISGGTAVFENNGITLTATSNDCHTANNVSSGYPADAIIPVEEGKPIKLIWKTTETVYMGDVYVFPNGGQAGMINVGSEKNIINYTPVSGVTFITVRFGVSTSGNTVHYKNIMVMDASITDDTYEPYHPPVSDWGYTRQEANVLGAKQWFFDEVYGLAFNSDTIGANTIISIAHSSFIAKVDKNTDYTISREGGNRFRVGLSTAFPANNVSCNLLVNDPDMKSFTFNSGNYEYVMAWMENATDTAENIKPLCTLASDTDRTYKKFAMTNRELTEVVTPDKTAFTDTKGTTSVNTIVKTGNIVVADLRTNGLTTAAWESIATIPAGYRPANNVWFVANDMTGGTLIRCALNSDGTVTCPSAISNKEIYIHAFWSIV